MFLVVASFRLPLIPFSWLILISRENRLLVLATLVRTTSSEISSGIFTVSCLWDGCRPPHSPAIESRGDEVNVLLDDVVSS